MGHARRSSKVNTAVRCVNSTPTRAARRRDVSERKRRCCESKLSRATALAPACKGRLDVGASGSDRALELDGSSSSENTSRADASATSNDGTSSVAAISTGDSPDATSSGAGAASDISHVSSEILSGGSPKWECEYATANDLCSEATMEPGTDCFGVIGLVCYRPPGVECSMYGPNREVGMQHPRERGRSGAAERGCPYDTHRRDDGARAPGVGVSGTRHTWRVARVTSP